MNQHMLVAVLLFMATSFLHAQAPISGQVIDYNGKSIHNVEVTILPLEISQLSTRSGEFSFDRVKPGKYLVVAQKLGYQTYRKLIEVKDQSIGDLIIQLDFDPLELKAPLKSALFGGRSKFSNPNAITTINTQKVDDQLNYGTSSLLQSIPGMFVDGSAGEIQTRVYVRGLGGLVRDDMGWNYVSLQEDGLPVTLINNHYYGPDIFHRPDLTIFRIEALTGGNSLVHQPNAPGATLNFISNTGKLDEVALVRASATAFANGNWANRYDFNLGNYWQKAGWSFNIGGFYRNDDGPRIFDSKWAQGGQLKLNVGKNLKNGAFRVFFKYLKDRVNRFNGLPATNWGNPVAMEGFDFSNNNIAFPNVETSLPDGRSPSIISASDFDFNPTRGIEAEDLALGFQFEHFLPGDWKIENKFKYTNKSADWQTVISGQPVPLDNPKAYSLSGSLNPFSNNVVFKDANTNEILARVDNLGAANGFFGRPTTFSYLEGSLPNDVILTSVPLKKLDFVEEWMNQLTLKRQFGQHVFGLKLFTGSADMDTYAQGSFAYATYESVPRLLKVSNEQINSPVSYLSDESGWSNYGGLLYENGSVRADHLSIAINDTWAVSDNLSLDLGGRFENIRHKGTRDLFDRLERRGGLDEVIATGYDNSILVRTGETNFDRTYNSFSWSLGANYLINDQLAWFSRGSLGHQPPQADQYFNFSFFNTPQATRVNNQPGIIQNFAQIESGIKLDHRQFSLLTTLFWSRLSNMPSDQYRIDGPDNTEILSPLFLNSTHTTGIEIEGVYEVSNFFYLNFAATFQSSETESFMVYRIGASDNDIEGDEIADYSNKKVPYVPGILTEVKPEFNLDKWRFFLSWRYIGERKGNYSNAFSLPGYHMFNSGVNYQLIDRFDVGLYVYNLFNSEGLMHFFGPTAFGLSAEDVDFNYIEDNLDQSFVVRSVLPRMVQFRANYRF